MFPHADSFPPCKKMKTVAMIGDIECFTSGDAFASLGELAGASSIGYVTARRTGMKNE